MAKPKSHKQANLMEGQLLGLSHIVGLGLVLVEMRGDKRGREGQEVRILIRDNLSTACGHSNFTLAMELFSVYGLEMDETRTRRHHVYHHVTFPRDMSRPRQRRSTRCLR